MEDEEPPFTLEQAEEWLHQLADKADVAAGMAYGASLVLGNLVRELSRTGVLDGVAFIGRLRLGTDQLPPGRDRQAAESYLDGLLAQLRRPAGDDSTIYH